MGEVLVFSLLVLASLCSASTDEMFIKEGGSVMLELRPAPSPITFIQWKFQDSILAEWGKGGLPLAHNRENVKLDIASGSLSMEKMTKAEEGVYSVEVNHNVQKVTYNVVSIKDVPKPSIRFSPLICGPESDQCTLTCEGDTTGAEPVTYSVKTGDGEWKGSEKVMPITKKDHGQVKTFTCKMKNPVSEEVSEPLPNKLYTGDIPVTPPNHGPVIGILVFLPVAAIAIGVWVFWARKNKKWPFGNRNIDPESPDKNGDASKDGANVELLEETSPTTTPPDAKPDSQDGPAGGADPHKPSPEDKTVSQGIPAEPPKPSPEENTVNAAPEGEANAKLDT